MTFPTDYDTLTRVSADDYLDTAGKEGDVIIDQIQDAIEATQAAIGKTGETAAGTVEARLAAVPAAIAGAVTAHEIAADPHGQYTTAAAVAILAPSETAATSGALIAGSTSKETPADGDLLGLADSAASWILRKWSWANLKTGINGIFARLAGIAGGQTLIGGTGAGDSLTLQGTSASGTTATNKAVKLLVGNAGGVEALTLLHNGYVGINKPDPGYRFQCGPTTANGFILSDTSHVGIGTTPGATTLGTSTSSWAKMALHYSAIRSTQNDVALSIRVNGNAAGNSSCINRALYAYVDTSENTFMHGTLRALQFAARHNGSGTCSNVTGLYGEVYNSSTGTVANAWASRYEAWNESTGTITSCIGNKNSIINSSTGVISAAHGQHITIKNSSTGVINTITGLNIGGTGFEWQNNGTVDTATALVIGSSTAVGSVQMAIDCRSTAASFFAGKIGIGNAAATAQVDVMATTTQMALRYDAVHGADFMVNSAGALKITSPLSWMPAASATPEANDEMTIERTSNTLVTIKLKGTDGVVRSGTITLS